ncbi:MAG: hypothetical protein OHK0039_21090 [Bacteroidia bacterium]
MKKVFACEDLSQALLAKAVQMGAQVIVTNNLSVPKEEVPASVVLIDGNIYREVGTWAAYRKAQAVIGGLQAKAPALLDLDGQDLRSTATKILYWSYAKQGYIKEALRQLGEPYRLLSDPGRIDWKRHLKNHLGWQCSYWQRRNAPHLHAAKAVEITARHLFYVEDDFQYQYLEDLLQTFEPASVAILMPHGHPNMPQERWAELSVQYQVVELPPDKPLRLPWIPVSRLTRDELYAAQVLAAALPHLGAWTRFIHSLQGPCPEALVLTAAENEGYGHLVARLARARGLATVNTMNGMKFATANNADTEFDAWLVWDKHMRRMLIDQCGLPSAQIVDAGGHLTEDRLHQHVFSGELPLTKEEIEQRPILTFASNRGLRQDKVDALTALYELMAAHPDWLMLYRPHPAEQPGDYFLPTDPALAERVRLVTYTHTNNKSTLYDQFHVSKLAIVLASTVGLEAHWSGLPVITFEQSERSLLYCVDGQHFFHENTIEGLQMRAQALMQAPSDSARNNKHPRVSSRYADIIREVIRQRAPTKSSR